MLIVEGREFDCWDLGHAKQFGRFHSSVSGKNATGRIDQNRICETKFLDASGKLLDLLKPPSNVRRLYIASDLGWFPDGRHFVTVSARHDDPTAQIWDLTGVHVRELRGHEAHLDSVVFSDDGERILTRAQDKTVRIWDPKSGESLRTLTGHTDIVRWVAFSPDQASRQAGERRLLGAGSNRSRE